VDVLATRLEAGSSDGAADAVSASAASVPVSPEALRLEPEAAPKDAVDPSASSEPAAGSDTITS
jgi:hypothetical protein